VWLLLVLLPAGLLYQNLLKVRAADGPRLKQYVSLVRERLPERDTVLLSDDPIRLFLLESALTQSGVAGNYLFLESGGWLEFPDYHRFLKRRYPRRWQNDPARDHQQFLDDEILGMVSKLADSNRLCYLHPSFGYFFEAFYAEPHGLLYRLKAYPTNSLLAPLPGKEAIAENEAFWTRVDEPVLQKLLPGITPPTFSRNPPFWDLLFEKAYIKKQPDRQATALGSFYSRALDSWGVELQKAGWLTNAAAHFQRALDLNPENRVAQLNLACNHDLREGGQLWVDTSGSVEDRFGHYYNNWEAILGANGPFDEPTMCYAQGRVFLMNRLFGQAAQQFARVKELVPGFLAARLLLAQLYLVRHMPDQALKVADQIHSQAATVGLSRVHLPYLLRVETSAHLEKNDIPGAESVVDRVLKQHPGDDGLTWTAAQVYKAYGNRALNDIFSRGSYLKATSTNLADLLAVQASDAVLSSNTWEAGEIALAGALKQYPTNQHLLRMSTELQSARICCSNFLTQIEELLGTNAENDELLRTNVEKRTFLLEKGFGCIQLKQFARATQPLTKILNLETNNAAEMQLYYNALLYRAYADLKLQKWDSSQRDYETLQKAFPTGPSAYRIYLGLAESALGQKDTNAAFRNYHFCLANVPTNSPEAETIRTRLADIKPPSRR
jgi:tetratricopeptide (TPR) repeat protein